MGGMESVALIVLVGFSAAVGLSGVATAIASRVRRRSLPEGAEPVDGRDRNLLPDDVSPSVPIDLSDCRDRCRRLSFVPATAPLASSLEDLSMRVELLSESLPALVGSRFAPGSLTHARFAEPADAALAEAACLAREATDAMDGLDADRYAYLLRKREAGRSWDEGDASELDGLQGMCDLAERRLSSARSIVDRLNALQVALQGVESEASGDGDVAEMSEELDRLARDVPEYGTRD